MLGWTATNIGPQKTRNVVDANHAHITSQMYETWCEAVLHWKHKLLYSIPHVDTVTVSMSFLKTEGHYILRLSFTLLYAASYFVIP